MESMHEELNELSAYAYDKIGWQQFSIENTQERLHNISNVIHKMDERWTRNDEATRSFIAAWSRMCRDEVDACFPTNLLQDPSRMITISTVDETSTSIDLQSHTTIDAYRCTSIDSHSGQVYLPNLDPDGHARAMDGRILQVSREDIADILQLANGPDNLFMQQRSIPDNIPAVPDEHPRADTTEIGSHQSCQPVGQTSIDKDALTSFDKAPSPSIDRRYECGRRAYDIYGARKFRWEQKDEYGVYRDESGYARSVAGEMIPVTKDNIIKILERASLFEESHICLPEYATSFTPTKLAPGIYTKDEINEMVTGICGAQEKLGDELKTLVDDTYQTLDRGYNELFRSMANMRTEIESMQHILEKKLRHHHRSTPTKQHRSTSSHRHPRFL
ncbi:hypothetical protein F2Q69_00030051 [Brassica cretica]|uniref:Uncharacterized protein n=1 Tax=Brassica cretica TaxID=69181 RepID=A0A8S9RYW8_BRACR|nr:hypothetical protein F2Q69_00030051 [Brassica cretica]